MFTYSNTTDKSVDDLTELFESSCANAGFSLLHSYNYSEILESKGFPIDGKVIVYEICQAKIAALVLKQNREFAPLMPCRIAIYDENGKTVVSAQNMEPMLEMISNESLKNETTSMFESIKKLINRLTN